MSEFKGVWIPAKLWICKDLSLIEKHFLAKIRGLDNADGCIATNAFFADFFDLSKSRCTQILKKLEDENYIKISLFRENNEIVKRVVNLLNRGIEFFKEGNEKTKQGTLEIKQGILKIKEGYLENSDSSNIEDKNKEEELNLEIESGSKKEPTHQNISEFNILQKKLEVALQEIESLKAEKEKEKSFAKKEKESSEPPPHKTDLEQTKNKAMWEFEILQNEMWLKIEKPVQDAFLEYCICHQEIEGRSLPTRSVFANLELVQKFLLANPPAIVAESLKLAVLNRNKTFDPKFVTNRKKEGFKSTKEKPLHNNDLVMKGESLNHLNKWNKAK